MKISLVVIAVGLLQITSTQAADQEPTKVAAALPYGADAPAAGSADSNAEALPADTTPDATVKLHGGSIAAGIGFVWGHGTVNYHGRAHRFSINGISVVDVGGAKISASGVVMHLDKLSDFEGNYIAWGAGVTLAAGGSAVYMKNEHGVVIKLLSSTQGLRFNLSGNGVKLRLQN